MNREAFEAHPLWATLTSLGEVAADDLSGDQSSQDDIDFIHAAIRAMDARRGIEPALVDPNTLDAINTAVTSARDMLTQYKEDPETHPGYLAQQVRPNLQSAVDQSRTLPDPPADAEAKAAQDALARYREAANAEVGNLREQIEALRTQLTALGEERDEQAEKAQTALTALQEQIQTGERTVATQTTALQEQIDQQRATFTEEATQREEKFKEAETAREKQTATDRKAQADRADALIADLEKSRQQAKDLLDAVNTDVVSGDYRGWANTQAKAAYRWTVTTVLIGIATVAALAVVVVLTAEGDSTQLFLSKISVGLFGLALAGYTGRQAAEHRHEERTANRLALDLAALEPYLEHVDNPNQLRTDIAKRVFVPQPAEPEQSRFSLGRRSMSMAELIEFARILRGIDQTGPPPTAP